MSIPQKKKFLLLPLFFAAIQICRASPDSVRVTIDVKNVVNDKVKVTVTTPQLLINNAVYILPASIPGSYSTKNFIRFIEDVKAFDKNGNSLAVEREADAQIRIPESRKLNTLEYYVNDSFDDSSKADYIFPPGGTNIQADTNFLINFSGFVGYFDGYKKLPYVLTFLKPAGFYGATSLIKSELSDTTDILKADDYVTLVDNPLMYSQPDTVSYMQGKTRITIAVNKGYDYISAKNIAEIVRPRTEAIEKFLGSMPVDRYTFIFYFTSPQSSVSHVQGFGALEHNYSSVYFLPPFREKDTADRNSIVGSTVVHEFLHILVPLNLHSEEIADFDFRAPKMSQHLWLYEGVTEYFSDLAEFQGGLIQEERFMRRIRGKIIGTESVKKPFSLTTFSKNILEPEYQKLYTNIYEKGAAAAFLLDIRLRELSKGEMTLLKLVKKLSAIYGPDKPFKDDELIDRITQLTNPEIGDFFKNYIVGEQPLPYKEYLEKIGWKYSPEKPTQRLSFGPFNYRSAIDSVTKKQTALFFTFKEGEQAKNLFGIEEGDEFLSINGYNILTDEKAQELADHMRTPADTTPLEIAVRRNGTIVTLKAEPRLTDDIIKHAVEGSDSPTPAETFLKGTFLRPDL